MENTHKAGGDLKPLISEIGEHAMTLLDIEIEALEYPGVKCIPAT